MRIRHTYLLFVLLAAVSACGGGSGRGASGPGGGGDDAVEERVVVEKMPDGSTRKTTIRTSRRTVPAPPPPPRPADPWPADPMVRHNVERINAFRAAAGAPPLLYDASISAFALAGSKQLSVDHAPHAHFRDHAQGAPGFGSRTAENQAERTGPPGKTSEETQIDSMMQRMMDEGPGGGHHDNMLNPRFRRVGVGLFRTSESLYLTNDFSD